ncbi:MAG: SDR family NAD(P)-dependent oxidoreductase [Coriobacteriia bacterium]|nr:SDR family NAD(P)-dependent oxidoreductase [Coriobacteriia bacterium]
MSGRTALVTGASRGIGRSIVDALESAGITVLAPTRAQLDLSSDGSVDAFLASLTGRVDVLVNNAGINPLATALEVSDDDIETTLRVNLISPMRLCRAIGAGMAQRGWGRIVNISSIWGTVSKPGRFAYSVSKSGINGMTRSLAVELGSRGVLVNAVAPGFVATDLTRQNNTPAQIAEIAAGLPLRRLAEPEEIAAVVLFLASEANTFVTGQVILADGGYSCL